MYSSGKYRMSKKEYRNTAFLRAKSPKEEHKLDPYDQWYPSQVILDNIYNIKILFLFSPGPSYDAIRPKYSN